MQSYDNGNAVDRPSHYALKDGRTLQDVFWQMCPSLAAGFSLLNAAKYRQRAGKKSISDKDEDLAKSQWYINDLRKHGYCYATIESLLTRILIAAASGDKETKFAEGGLAFADFDGRYFKAVRALECIKDFRVRIDNALQDCRDMQVLASDALANRHFSDGNLCGGGTSA